MGDKKVVCKNCGNDINVSGAIYSIIYKVNVKIPCTKCGQIYKINKRVNDE